VRRRTTAAFEIGEEQVLDEAELGLPEQPRPGGQADARSTPAAVSDPPEPARAPAALCRGHSEDDALDGLGRDASVGDSRDNGEDEARSPSGRRGRGARRPSRPTGRRRRLHRAELAAALAGGVAAGGLAITAISGSSGPFSSRTAPYPARATGNSEVARAPVAEKTTRSRDFAQERHSLKERSRTGRAHRGGTVAGRGSRGSRSTPASNDSRRPATNPPSSSPTPATQRIAAPAGTVPSTSAPPPAPASPPTPAPVAAAPSTEPPSQPPITRAATQAEVLRQFGP
jgi:hypothetical protein